MTFVPTWTEDRIKTLLALKAEGLSDYEVARKMGCSRTAVANKLSRMRNPRATVRKAGLWDEHRVALLTKLWAQGKSAAEVAAALNAGMDPSRFVSRNAVIGAVWRRGLSQNGRAPAARPARPVKQAPERVAATNRAKAAIVSRMNAEPAKPRPPKVEAVPLAAIESPNARPWMEREFGQCAWPPGEAGAIMSCCNPVSRGSWCEAHAEIGFDGHFKRFASGKRRDAYSSIETEAVMLTRFERIDAYVPTGERKPRADRPTSRWDDARAAA